MPRLSRLGDEHMSKAAEQRDQHQRFVETARELGCDEDPEAFKRAVRQIAKAPPPAPRKRKERDRNGPPQD